MRTLIRKTSFAMIIMALSGISSFAANDWGPALGSTIPANLSATTPAGDTVALAALARQGNGVAIAFVRSADWCPFCKRQLIELSERAADFEQRGLTLVSISYDDANVLGSFTEQFDINFRLLSDPKSEIIDAFGIRNEDQKPGSAGDGIPHPGIMIFNTKGELTAKFAEKSYRKRPQIDDVLAAFDAQNK